MTNEQIKTELAYLLNRIATLEIIIVESGLVESQIELANMIAITAGVMEGQEDVQ